MADDVVHQIRSLIAGERLAAGTRLPSERELAGLCGASRAVIAQALRSLSLMGLVEIRQGAGAFVARNPQAMVAASVHLMMDLQLGSLEHLCEFRLLLETDGALGALGRTSGAAALAAELEKSLDRLARCESVSSFVAADTNFHALLVGGAQNPYLTTIYESVHTAILSVEYRRWVARADDAPAWSRSPRAEGHLGLHRSIVDALRTADAGKMRAALRRHHGSMLAHLKIAPADG
jgi:GntR family transcriptional repressor for pyruvate dehydrogenase complex